MALSEIEKELVDVSNHDEAKFEEANRQVQLMALVRAVEKRFVELAVVELEARGVRLDPERVGRGGG